MTIVMGQSTLESDCSTSDRDSVFRGIIFVAILLLVLIGLHPFLDLSSASDVSADTPTDFVYHIVALALCCVNLFLASQILRCAMVSLVRIFAIALLAWLLVSVATSLNTELSARRLFVSLTDISLAATILLVPRNVQQFVTLLAIACA